MRGPKGSPNPAHITIAYRYLDTNPFNMRCRESNVGAGYLLWNSYDTPTTFTLRYYASDNVNHVGQCAMQVQSNNLGYGGESWCDIIQCWSQKKLIAERNV